MIELRILIIDIYNTANDLLQQQLKRLGHTICDIVTDIPQALPFIHKADPAVETGPMVAILLLPDQKPGSFTDDIQALMRQRQIPLLMLSHRDDLALVEVAQAAGLEAYLTLPADDSTLTWALMSAISGFQKRAAPPPNVDDQGILQSLNTAALAVQQTLNPQEIIRATARALEDLGLECTVLLSDADQSSLEIAFTSFYPHVISAAEKLTGLKTVGYRIPAERLAMIKALLQERRPILLTDTQEIIRQMLPQRLEKLTAPLTRLCGVSRLIIAPLMAKDILQGALIVHAAKLDASHLPGVTAFANQVAIALRNARAHAEIKRRMAEQAALLEASTVISSTLDSAAVLKRLARQMGQAIDATAACICDWDSGTDTTTVLAKYLGPDASEAECATETGETYALQKEFPYKLQHLRQAKPVVIQRDAPQLSQAEREHMARRNIKSSLLIPLQVKGNVIGYAELWESRDTQTFTPAQVALCQGIANQAAIAIENARLFKAQAQRRQEAETLYQVTAALISTLEQSEVLDLILGQLATVVAYDSAAVLLLQGNKLKVVAARGFPEGKAACDAVFDVQETQLFQKIRDSRCPLILQDAQTQRQLWAEGPALSYVRGWMGIPLLVKDQVIGCLTVDSHRPDAFGPQDATLVQAYANQAAIAIENARLFQTERAQARRQTALSRLSAELAATLDEKEICRRAIAGLHDTLGYDYIALLLVDQKSGERVVASGVGWPTHLVQRRFAPGQGLSERPLQDGQLHYTPDVSQEPGYIPGLGCGAEVDVPLKLDETVLGVLVAENYAPHAFDAQDFQVLQAAANQTAVAIQNARLYHKQSQLADELGRLQRASDTLFFTTTPNIPTLAQNIVEAVLREFGQTNCSLLLLNTTTGRLERIGAAGPHAMHITWPRLNVDGPGLVARAARDGKLINVPDVTRCPDYITGWKRTQSELVIPLQVGERLIGMLDVQSDQPAAFGPVDERLLSTFAERAALALENARLYHDVQSYTRLLQATAREKEQLLAQVRQHAETLEQKVTKRTAEIFAEKEKVEAILKSAGDALAITDHQSRISYVNDAFTVLTGYPAEELVGQIAVKIFTNDREPSAVSAALRQVATRGLHWRGDIQLTRRDGRVIEAEMNIAPIRDENGRLIHFIASLRDVSQARALERAKSEFINNVSHQFRTPVTNLKSYVYLLQKGAVEKRPKYVQTIRDQVKELAHLVQGLIEITELDAGPIVTDWQPLSPTELVGEMIERVQSQAAAAGLSLDDVTTDTPAAQVLGDKDRLVQALDQILDNAIRFTEAGKIEIGVRLETETTPGESQVVIWVTDSGPGIPPQELDQLFERFFRGQAAQPGHILGTGLGLPIAQSIVQAHHGHIKVRSTVGQGSTFEIWLPALD